MIIKFPDGQEVDVVYEDQGHTYNVSHKLAANKWSEPQPTHGITAPLELIPKPFLKAWASKLGVNKMLELIFEQPAIYEQLADFWSDYDANANNERTENDKPVCSDYMLKKRYPWYTRAKSAFKDASDEGKEFGSWLHGSIEDFYKSDRKTSPIVSPDVENMWNSFKLFDNFFKPKPDDDGIEFLVYSQNFGYSGMGDFRGMMSGKHCIGDWKSTNRSFSSKDGISVDYFFQVGGLAQAEFERTGKWVDDLFIANFDKKSEDPRVMWASEFGMAPVDAAQAYVTLHNAYHTWTWWDYKFKRG